MKVVFWYLRRKKWFDQLRRYLIVGVGSVICGIAINAFLVPHHMLSGGVSGIAMFNYFLFSWPIGLQVAIMNIPLLIAAYRLLDKEYVIGALYGMVIFSFSIDATSFLVPYNLVDDIMLASIYGGVINGIGTGMVFRVNGSAGGLDIVAAILKKYYAFNMGVAGFAINIVIMIIAGWLFGAKPAMYTLLSMYMGAIVTDKVVEGFNRKKTVMIISQYDEEISEAILKEMGRGVTYLQGEGAYTRQDRRILFVVVTLVQIARIKFIVERIDPKAFMIVQDAAEVMGKGFTRRT